MIKYKLSKYNLIDTQNNSIIKYNVELTAEECSILNYAYCLNQTTLYYVKH